MSKCLTCHRTDQLVMSGIEALLIGVPEDVERICYLCAYNKVNNIKVIHRHYDSDNRTELIEYEPGCWEVITYDSTADIDDIINNTGTIDNFPEAESEYELHLDLYYGITLNESLTTHAPTQTKTDTL